MINLGSPFITNRSGVRQTRFAGDLNKKKERAVSSTMNQAHRQLRRQNAFVVLDGEVFPKDSGLRFQDIHSERPEVRGDDKTAVQAKPEQSSVDAVWGLSKKKSFRQVTSRSSVAIAQEKANERQSRLEKDTFQRGADSDAESMTATEVDSASEDEVFGSMSQSLIYSWKDRQREVHDITQQALLKLKERRSQKEPKPDVPHQGTNAQQLDSK